jgi:choline dehydrogenase
MASFCGEKFCADYVVIGLGQAGAVAASVLSNEASVIGLEAGNNEDTNPIVVGPIPSITIPYDMNFYWPGNTLPDVDANNRIFDWTNGRVLGGGSTINGQIYCRGSPERFDEWAAIVGAEWNSLNVYATYKEMENFYGPTDDPNTHGYTGLMAVRSGPTTSNTTQKFLDALNTTGAPGIQEIQDYNSPSTPIGSFRPFQYWQFPNGTRASSSRTFLNPNIVDANGNGVNGRKLKVFVKTTATHLKWKGDRVKGVYAVREGKPIYIKVKRDVFVSAGLKSSGFLQVNGIGPKAVLNNANVPLRIELPTGVGMKNNYFIPNFMIPPAGPVPPAADFNNNPATFYSAGAFLPDPRPGYPTDIRNVELSSLLLEVAPGFRLFFIVLEAPLRPFSSGSIQIQNADPLKIENADIGFLHDDRDLETTLAGFKLLVIPMMQYLQTQGYTALVPSPAIWNDDDALRDYIQNNVSNGHHYQCSNRMAPENQGGVVDKWGKVYHTKNLIVADDSIAPLNIDGNPGAIAEMMAYRIAKYRLQQN